MEEVPENGKKSSHSAHASGIQENRIRNLSLWAQYRASRYDDTRLTFCCHIDAVTLGRNK